jgi:hypothetical protein
MNCILKLFSGFLVAFLFSCCDNKIDGDLPKRNILFYIGGDSNLSDEATQKINLIRAGWLPGKGEMIIYVDQRGSGASLLRINETKDADGSYGLDTLTVYGKQNSADAGVFGDVINQMMSSCPAESYGLIFFSHASGWLPEGTLVKPRSIGGDDGEGSPRREMEYYDFASAIPDKQFDFILFEACLMADVISMYELRNKAEYILASSAEIVSPGFGGINQLRTDIYKNEIMRLYDTKNDIKSVVLGFAQSYYDHIASLPEDNIYCSATLSLIKMDEMGNLAAVTKTALQGKEMDEATLGDIDEIQGFDRPRDPGLGGRPYCRYFDFAQTVEKLASESQYTAFSKQLDKVVVWKAATNRFLVGQYGFLINRHSGLTTYIKQTVYPEINAAFENSSWYKAIQ